MELYVANATKQDHDFQYRAPGTGMIQLLQIKKGAQVKIQGDTPALEEIVEQHRRYGIVDVLEFEKMPKFSGLVYSFGKPIKVDKIYHALDHHDEVIDENAQNIREQSTAATNAAIEEHAGSSGAEVNETSFELKEIQTDKADDSPKVEVLVRADKRADPKTSRSNRRPSRGH